MASSQFAQFYFAKRRIIFHHQGSLDLNHPQSQLLPVLNTYLKAKGIKALLGHYNAQGRTGQERMIMNRLNAICDETRPTGARVTSEQFFDACEKFDKIATSVIKHTAFEICSTQVAVDPPQHLRAEGDDLIRACNSSAEQVLFHYPDHDGFDRIMASRQLSAFHTAELRAGTKNLVYVSKPPFVLPSDMVHTVVRARRRRPAARSRNTRSRSRAARYVYTSRVAEAFSTDRVNLPHPTVTKMHVPPHPPHTQAGQP